MAKWLKKRSVPEFWGSPGIPLETPKSSKSQKNDIENSIKIQNDSKGPPRADLNGFGVARILESHEKVAPKPPSELKTLTFEKVHISLPLPMREGVRALEKT